MRTTLSVNLPEFPPKSNVPRSEVSPYDYQHKHQTVLQCVDSVILETYEKVYDVAILSVGSTRNWICL